MIHHSDAGFKANTSCAFTSRLVQAGDTHRPGAPAATGEPEPAGPGSLTKTSRLGGVSSKGLRSGDAVDQALQVPLPPSRLPPSLQLSLGDSHHVLGEEVIQGRVLDSVDI